MMRAVFVLALAMWLGGCATSGAAWISASQFDRRDYIDKKVAIMPATIEALARSGLDRATIQEAIAGQLDVLEIKLPILVTPEQAAEVKFPYTPARLAEFGRAHCYDAVVGATIVRVDARAVAEEWSFTGTITFVDSKLLERQWTIAKTWTMSGSPLDENATSRVGNALYSDLFDVRQVLRRGRGSWLLRRSTVVVDPGPILVLDAAEIPRADSNAFLRVFLNRPNKPSLTTSAQQLSVDVFAVDDAGLFNVEIVNGDYRVPIYSERNVSTTQSVLASRPIYVAQRVGVPLESGTNNIQLIGENAKGQRVVRDLSVNNGAAAEVARGSVAAAVIVADSSNLPNAPAPTLSAQTRQRIEELESSGGANMADGTRAVVFSGPSATRENILESLMIEWSRPALGTRRLLFFIGRAEEAVGMPYLMLGGGNAKHPENHSLSLEELQRVMKLEVERVVLDLCTVDTDPTQLRASFQRFLAPDEKRIEISVTQGCETPIGRAFLETHRQESDSATAVASK
jgi:hypothetical protein